MSEPITASDSLSRCADFFALAASGQDTVPNAVSGLRSVLFAATFHPDPAGAPPDAIIRAAAAIRAATPVVANCASSIPEDRVWFGMSAASGLVNIFGRPAEELRREQSLALVLDRIDHTALLADELDALHRRREIAARGNVLCRNFAIRRALEASADGATLH